MGVSSKKLVIDGKNHLLGRLASTVAKQLLIGNRVVVLRCDDICISGNFHRSKLKYLSFLRKRMNVNPRRGPFHLREPRKIFWRTVRGMLPHKTVRGKNALDRLEPFEGVPPKYEKTKKMVVPSSLRHLCLKTRRKHCTVGRLAHEVGWQRQEVLKKLAAKRRVKNFAYHSQQKKIQQLKAQAIKNVAPKIEKYQQIIESYGYK